MRWTTLTPLPLLLLAVVGARAAVVDAADTGAGAKQPHIVVMFADDFGHNNVGFRNPEVRTPTIDALAQSGIAMERLYTYKYCSPSRSSFLTGRLPVHVNQNNNCNLVTYPGGADLRMKLLPQRLRDAGYATAMTGKWHCGARSAANLPANRGFDSHFGFLKGGEDHITQESNDAGIRFVDLWRDHAPAYGENGTFSTFIYAKEAVRVIEQHGARLAAAAAAAAANATSTDAATTADATADDAKPLFLYLAWQATHAPLEAPARFVHAVDDDTAHRTRAHMNGLAAALDEGVANVTRALKGAGMWDTTLLLFMADNGGWLGPTFGGNNWPPVKTFFAGWLNEHAVVD